MHGLAVQTAEAMAEWIHRRIRKEWSLPIGQGKRYSPGYPACPEQRPGEVFQASGRHEGHRCHPDGGLHDGARAIHQRHGDPPSRVRDFMVR